VDGGNYVHDLVYVSASDTWGDINLNSACADPLHHIGSAPPPRPGGAVASTTLAGEPRIYYVEADSCAVAELAYWGGRWRYRALSVDGGGPPADPHSPLTATTLDGNPRVYYIATDSNRNSNIWELAWLPGWNRRNVSGDAVGPLADPESPLTSATIDGNPRVYYMAAADANLDCYVWELAWFGNHWWPREMGARLGGTNARMLTSTTVGDNPRLYYLGGDYTDPRAVVEMAYQDNHWVFRAIASSTGAPPGDADSSVASTTLAGNPRVYYLAYNATVNELARWDDNSWHHRPVSAEARAPGAAFGSPLSSITLGDSPRVYYVGYDGGRYLVHELAYRSDSNSWAARTISS
jgi:hypothetical protein